MIERLLVANRGEIARRVMRSAQAMGIACVAIHSDPDATSPHVREADLAVRLPGEHASETYLRIDAIVEAALSAGAQAVHPGYGFLSENADFARACESAGLVFVGPPSGVIEAMGSKLAAKATMAAAGVPVLPTVEVPRSVVPDDDAVGAGVGDSLGDGDGVGVGGGLGGGLATQAAALGWPVLVKASAGGGGRGMRVVHDVDGLGEALASARREAAAAFGDGTVFLEPYVTRPRHVEVQILGDSHGNVVHLFERECSIQRRHQKVIEEAPSPSVGEELRSALGEAALKAAHAIGYVNAGTVEFLLLRDGTFAFLEVNTRLQVEHTVTECVTGLDLVRLQLLVADGLPLPKEVFDARLSGHAIEVRLYAEDPTKSWQPSAGRLHRLSVFPVRPEASHVGAPERSAVGTGDSGEEPRRPSPDTTSGGTSVRVDSGVEDGSVVSTYYDPLLAKVIAHAPTRPEAARALSRALELSHIHGLQTNRDLLARILRHPEFLGGDFDTGFLERHDPAMLGAPLATADAEQLHAAAAALSGQAERRLQAKVLAQMPSGWRNVKGPAQKSSFVGRNATIEVGYRFDRSGTLTFLEIDTKRRDDLTLVSCGPEEVVLRRGTTELRYCVHRVGREVFVDGPDGASGLIEVERFPLPGSRLAVGALVAPLPGTVVNVRVEVGAQVKAGHTLLAIEAMKMEHEVRALVDGTVGAVNVKAGQQVEAGTVLVVVEPYPGASENESP